MRNKETTLSYFNTQNTFGISTFPQMEENINKKESEDFITSLEKGYKEINMMYRNIYNKPYVSFQCNYYCNLNVYPKNEDSINSNLPTKLNDSIQCLDIMANNIKEEHN